MTLTVDREAVNAEVSRRRAIRESQFVRWIATRFVIALLAFYAIAVAVRFFTEAPALRDMTGWTLTMLFGVPALVAFVVTMAAERLTFGEAALDPDRAAARLAREVERLTGPGWPLRALLAALGLAVTIGVLLGVVVYWTGKPALLARGSDQAIAVFASGVLLASLVLVFVIRAVALMSYRRFLVTSSTPA